MFFSFSSSTNRRIFLVFFTYTIFLFFQSKNLWPIPKNIIIIFFFFEYFSSFKVMISKILMNQFLFIEINILLEFCESFGFIARESLVSFDCFCDSSLKWQILFETFRLICKEIFPLRLSSNWDILKRKRIQTKILFFMRK